MKWTLFTRVTLIALMFSVVGAKYHFPQGEPLRELHFETPPKYNEQILRSLGIDPGIAYEETTVYLHPGDRCTLYTGGLLEARAPSGEIFSFERLQALFASAADAAQASAAAVAFGQEDDITVVTLTRLANA
jgi:hypothetical protein